MKIRTLFWIMTIAAVCILPLTGCAPQDGGGGAGGGGETSTSTGS